jgi:thiamine-phosphate pyrophosphorylase
LAGEKKTPVDYSLYLVTDGSLSLGRSNLDVIRAAVAGGVTLVQFRGKDLNTRRYCEEGAAIRDFLSAAGIPLIINDLIDVALALEADGVHLGRDDMPIAIARKLLGPEKIVGVSVFTLEEAKAAEAEGADYLGLSPIFVTSTKPELTRAIGIEGIPPIREAVRIPLVGIGSMNRSTACDAVRAGLDGVAVISAIVAEPDVEAAARAIKEEVLRGKRAR